MGRRCRFTETPKRARTQCVIEEAIESPAPVTNLVVVDGTLTTDVLVTIHSTVPVRCSCGSPMGAKYCWRTVCLRRWHGVRAALRPGSLEGDAEKGSADWRR